MKKQRILAAFLALLMMLGMLAGCSGDDNQSVPTNGNDSQSDNHRRGRIPEQPRKRRPGQA